MKKSIFTTHLHPVDPNVPAPAIEFQIRQTIPVGTLVAGETVTIRATGRLRAEAGMAATYRKNPQRQRGVFGKRLHRRGWAPL